MSLVIRENQNGRYIFIDYRELEEGVLFAVENKLEQIKIRNTELKKSDETLLDLKPLELLGEQIKVLSLDSFKNIGNFDSIYSLTQLEIMYMKKQKYELDVSKFQNLLHLGVTYWSKLINIDKAVSLTSMVLIRYPKENLSELSNLVKLQDFHLYFSKITTLKGIENLPINYMFLANDKALTDISALKDMKCLNRFEIERCPQLTEDMIRGLVSDSCTFRIIK